FLFRKKPHLQCVDNGVRNLILDGKNVVQIAVVTFGPDMAVIGTVDQLRRDPNPAGRFAHTSFNYMADVELAGDLANIDCLSLKRESRVSRYHVERGDLA